MPKRMIAAAFTLAAVLGTLPGPSYAEANTVTCSLTKAGDAYAGSCQIPCAVNALAINIDGPRPGFTCDAPDRRVQATLKQQGKFDDWLGTMEGKEPEDPTRFGLIKPKDGKPGVAKLPFGWFALTDAQLNGDRLDLTIAANRQLPPTADDIRIIDRAIALLDSEKVWNKQDDRKCPSDASKWSVFCAMMQATTEVSGGVHYRQPAMQALREVINEVGGTRVGKHRLMDYNNHPDTTLDDIHALLMKARERLKQRS